MEPIATKAAGDALELSVEHIFKVANFKTSRNVKIAGYEIDVLAEVGDRSILIECKNYQNARFTVRNLIHQWKSKNEIIRANKIIIVIAGFEIKQSDKDLANDLDISLWDQDTLTKLFNLSLKPEELKDLLLEDISFKPISISEQYRDKIGFITMQPFLSNIKLSDSIKYERLGKWLRSFIITELSIDYTSPSDRSWHISIFEGLKTHKGGLFGLSTVTKTSVQYWQAIESALKEDSFSESDNSELTKKYLGYMSELEEEWQNSIRLFNEASSLERLKNLIEYRTHFARLRNEQFSLKLNKKGVSTIHCKLDEYEDYIVSIEGIDYKTANTLSWIFTSTWFSKNLEKGSLYFWIFNSHSEVVEMLFRYFTEFGNYSESDVIIDPSLISLQIS